MRPCWVWVGVFGATLLGGVTACSDAAPECYPLVIQSDTACTVSTDCAEGGNPGLTCIDGACRVPCTTDVDCSLQPDPDVAKDVSLAMECRIGPAAVCDDQICVPACSADADCSDGQRCLRLSNARAEDRGRCSYYMESFEIPPNASGVDFSSIGWSLEVPGRLENPRLKIAWTGIVGCNNADPTVCGGVAGTGVRYALLESQSTPPKGTPVSAPTCGACACCLECLVDPPLNSDASAPFCSGRCEQERESAPTAYCGIASPAPFDACPASNPGCLGQPVCPASMPSRCASVCSACAACPAQTAEVGGGLAACEATAANKGCAPCPGCDACTSQQCPVCSQSGMAAECDSCVKTQCVECRSCNACSELARCVLSEPDSSECLQLRRDCDAQGNDGCYQTPVDYPRNQLTDAEQALISPPLSVVAGLGGNVVLEFGYVAFNVGRSYFPGVQGQAPPLWSEAEQELLVQFCAANCEQEGSFTTAQFPDGRPVSLPPANLRGNGLSVQQQSSLDWRGGRVRIPIPENYRTSTFRVRFVPHLGESVQIGLDDVTIRRRN